MKISSLTVTGLILSLQILSSPALALDVIATAARGGSATDIDAVVRLANATNVRPVFSPDERRMLIGAGRKTLAEAKKFTIGSERALIDLKSKVSKRRLAVRLEPAEIEFQLDGPRSLEDKDAPKLTASFESLQWAIKNIGQRIPIAMDDLTSLFVKGKPGEDIGIENAPKESKDPKRQITIAVLDTGIDFGHPELLDRVVENIPECRAIAALTACRAEAKKIKLANEAETTAAATSALEVCDAKYLGKDFDGNGYPLDCSGWNVTTKSAIGDNVWGDADATDKNGHGTHVAGVISARGDDRDGIRGAMENVRILPVKVITAAPTAPIRPKEMSPQPSRLDLTGVPKPTESSLKTEKGLGDIVARGLLYAIRSGAQVVNMSLGWPVDVDSPLMAEMISLARTRGILLVAASGNDGTDALIRPCVFDGMICVASHDPDGAISHFSNYGAGVDIAAPGQGILSLFPTSLNPRVFTDRNGYDLKNGTSMATPYISALLGRLLNAGFSPDEARARLLVGARPSSPNPRVNRAHPLLVQSGNADLARAFKAAPQPLILPSSKRPIEILWDRRSKKIDFKLDLGNEWTDASTVKVQFKLPGLVAQDARISPAVLSEMNWAAGEVRSFDLVLDVSSQRLESDFTAEMVVTAVDAKTGNTTVDTRYVAIEILAVPDTNDPEIETHKISGPAKMIADLPASALRSVQSIDGRNDQDYLSMTMTDETLRVALLKQERKGYRFHGSAELPATAATLMLVQRVDIDSDGSSDYVMIWKTNPTAAKKMPTFLFRFFDADFKPLAQTFDGKTAAEYEYSNSIAVLTDSFQWIRAGKRKVPAWITRGTTPELEKKPYDPWNPTPLDLPDVRLYVLSERGLVTLSIEDKFPVAFFPATREEMISGNRRIMWIAGDGTDAVHEISTIQDLNLSKQTALNLGGFRRIRSTMMAPLLSLTASLPEAGETIGVGVYSDSYRSALRVTGLISNSSSSASSGAAQALKFDKILTPEGTVDSVTSVLAGFATSTESSNQVSVISQTNYEMQFDDLKSGETASATLRRFSFMPEFFFEKFYRPVIGDNSLKRSERLPMVYLAQGLGTGSSLEVIAPRYEAGKLKGFARPARLRLVAPDGCESMGDTIDATSLAPTRLVFVCADRIMFVPLKY